MSWHDAARQAVAALAGTPAYVTAGRARRKVEARFAELKRYVGLRRLRLRGLPRAAEQFLLAATAQNLKRPAAARPPERLFQHSRCVLALSGTGRHAVAEPISGR